MYMTKYTLLLHNQQLKDLKQFAKNITSVSDLIRTAINEFVDKKKKEELNASISIS